jgi:Na+-translocating ferredoxin:NAD+ oxidoreductase subunit D
MTLRISTGPHILTKENTRFIMTDVLIALAPVAAAGIYLYGLRAAWVLAVASASAVISEFVWQKLTRQSVKIYDMSALVTGLILGLNLPSSAPLWLPAIGSALAIIIVKQLFGGIGHNFINPAMLARAVLLTSWPVRMAAYYPPSRLIAGTAPAADAVTSATTILPTLNLTGKSPAIMDLLLGNIPGSIGEVCKVAILIGLAYMLISKTITWHIPVLFVGSAALMAWILGGNPLATVLSGGILFGAVFMATDYVTSPMLRGGQCIFAVGCGIITIIIRKFGSYPEGVTYAILLMNILTPLIDKYMHRRVYGEVKKHAKK